MFLKNDRGLILVTSLGIVTVLLIIGGIFIVRTVSEKNLSDLERRSTRAFYLADAGSQAALNRLNEIINKEMMSFVNERNPQVVAQDAQAYVLSSDGLGFLVEYAKDSEGVDNFVLNGEQASYSYENINLGDGFFDADIIVEEKSNPLVISSDMWDFPYLYQIQVTGEIEGIKRKVMVTGDFTVRVQRDNFAKFSLFTNQQNIPPSDPMYPNSRVWFTDKTNFAGPVHTNARFNFALNPSATFESIASQQFTQARFYNEGSPILADSDSNEPDDVPTFHADFIRGADAITLDSSVQQEDMVNQAKGGSEPSGNGIFVPNNGSCLTGGIFVRGDASISLGIDASDYAQYTIMQGGTTKIITVDHDLDQTTVETIGEDTDIYCGKPDGMDDLGTLIYIEGSATSVGGVIQRDTELTLSTQDNIIITDNIQYSEYAPPVGNPGDIGYIPPHAQDSENMFGMVSWDGDVTVGTAAPDDVNIHGTIMAMGEEGVFYVDDYWDQGVGSRGMATLLGGVITGYYGAFGLFSGTTGNQLSGYGRNFVYDERTLKGKAPPYYPSMKTFIAFTNDLTDKLAWQEGGF